MCFFYLNINAISSEYFYSSYLCKAKKWDYIPDKLMFSLLLLVLQICNSYIISNLCHIVANPKN